MIPLSRLHPCTTLYCTHAKAPNELGIWPAFYGKRSVLSFTKTSGFSTYVQSRTAEAHNRYSCNSRGPRDKLYCACHYSVLIVAFARNMVSCMRSPHENLCVADLDGSFKMQFVFSAIVHPCSRTSVADILYSITLHSTAVQIGVRKR